MKEAFDRFKHFEGLGPFNRRVERITADGTRNPIFQPIGKPEGTQVLLANLPDMRSANFRLLLIEANYNKLRASLAPLASLFGRTYTDNRKSLLEAGFSSGYHSQAYETTDRAGYRRILLIPPVITALYSTYSTPLGVRKWRFNPVNGAFDVPDLRILLRSVPVQVEIIEGVNNDPLPTLAVYAPGLGYARQNLETLRQL